MKLYIEQVEGDGTEPGEIHLHLRFRPTNLLGILLIIALHVVIIYGLASMRAKNKPKPEGEERIPITMVVERAKKTVAARSKTIPKPTTAIPHSERAITLPPPVPNNAPTIQQLPPEVDMSAMLNAARERRRAADEAAAAENNAARQEGHEMTAQEKAVANVNHSMEMANGGTGGLFSITNKGTRTANLSFKGWDGKSRQSYVVDAGLGGDLDRALVRKVIDIIRIRYKNRKDVPWESRRLGRVVPLSTLPEDNDDLEAFLMKEFFNYNH